MAKSLRDDQWIWVVVQDPGGDEQFLGQEDKERKAAFIPVFLEKEEAEAGLDFLSKDEARKYEVQAIRFDDLKSRLAETDFMVFVLSREGEVREKISPGGF